MRIVGVALLSAWMIAWWAAPHGERARTTTLVGGVSIAGGERPAVAWLELKHGQPNQAGTVHAAWLDESGAVLDHLSVYAGSDAVTFRLADAGGGRFVLAAEYRNAQGRWFEFHRFGTGARDRPEDLKASFDASAWNVVAAGDELVLTEEVVGETVLHVLSVAGKWTQPTAPGDVLVGAGDGHVITYTVGARQDEVMSLARDGAWRTDVTDHPSCITMKSPAAALALDAACNADPACLATQTARRWEPHAAATVLSVVPLRGGYARLSRYNLDASCIDGLRDGKRFTIRDLSLKGYAAPRLSVEDGRLVVYDSTDGKGRRRIIDADGSGATRDLAIDSHGFDEGLRYRLVAPGGTGAITALATRTVGDETQVAIERFPLAGGRPSQRMLAPARNYHPDHRPQLTRLAIVPLLALALAALGAFRLRRRFSRLVVVPANAPLPEGRVTIEAALATDADAPTGGLRLRRGHGGMTLFIEGAEILRGSEVRPRDQPRGDAVDVASGAPVVASGTVHLGSAFRGEDTLRAGPGDFVLVGCTLAEARRRLSARFASSLSLLVAAATMIGYLVTAP